jgi:prepilin-type processing-associated H-X9-DG protein
MTNPDLITDPQNDLLAQYIAANPGIFKCPADIRRGLYGGSNPSLRGTIIPAVRSVSMNQGVGSVCFPYWESGSGHYGAPTYAVNGPWLDNSHQHKANHPYATFGRTTDFGFCSPAEVFTTVDENPYSINDAGLAVTASEPVIHDYPADFHNNSCGFAFADGHGEMHHWRSTLFHLTSGATQITAQPGSQYADWFWFASHATKSRVTGTVP